LNLAALPRTHRRQENNDSGNAERNQDQECRPDRIDNALGAATGEPGWVIADYSTDDRNHNRAPNLEARVEQP